MPENIKVPLNVDATNKSLFINNYSNLTHGSGNLFLVAGDQRVEHLITSFLGEGISPDDLNPEHYFKIAKNSNIGAFSTQVGYLTTYGMDYKEVPYIVKLNSISKVTKEGYGYSFSRKWVDVAKIKELKEKNNLNILGIGYTLYMGIKNESKMLAETSKVINKSHSLGFPVVLWIYPKGNAVKNETDPILVKTAANIGGALGADFIKINAPDEFDTNMANLGDAVVAAGRSKVIVAGGKYVDPEEYLQTTDLQLKNAKTYGVAVGRNIHQKSYIDAVKFCNAIYSLVVEKKELSTILKEYKSIQSIV
ncbi:aldolase [candidate division WWE3 bacterium CG10_big_fil_rev_8_21_14_0_10_32_10]|uniref:fructose-bisphosphate aldolase n=1 Tax=candidate division WWE3 bacterium CG10_big_fil_rev_8_21_14_0_10_32_10 TaxID=1975090 RepID=A0A2H0RAP7_UNCKA|nr:MAG: aldolase [candidate division WWE3 bacterium CG10_big_fil_rev_8_21_14_0_10_32_10]